MNESIPAPNDASAARSPLELLDAGRIEAALSQTGLSFELHQTIDSTNRALAGQRHRHRHVVVAEHQYAGRGRRGRSWWSPPSSGLCLSFGFEFQCGLQCLGPLSLAVGIALAETLRAVTGLTIQLKWPNDLMREGKKLGGVLIEVQGDAPCKAIIGVGLNVQLPDSIHQTTAAVEDAALGRGWTDLQSDGAYRPLRNRLVIEVSTALDRACAEFDRHGFDAFASRWPALDVLAGQTVRATLADGSILEGETDGISAEGGLWLNTDSDRLELKAAEVSVRVR